MTYRERYNGLYGGLAEEFNTTMELLRMFANAHKTSRRDKNTNKYFRTLMEFQGQALMEICLLISQVIHEEVGDEPKHLEGLLMELGQTADLRRQMFDQPMPPVWTTQIKYTTDTLTDDFMDMLEAEISEEDMNDGDIDIDIENAIWIYLDEEE